jgi:hypothetical protein
MLLSLFALFLLTDKRGSLRLVSEMREPMTRAEAEAVLRGVGRKRIKSVYDDDPRVGDALSVLLPGFEYPDVSHFTGTEALGVAEIRAANRRTRCADCGAEGETTGHMTCQYPQDH